METGRRKLILIVENDERFAGILHVALENGGFDTYTTWSGFEALALLQFRKFDVLLLDDYVADLHAGDFLKRIGQLPICPGIVIMQHCSPTSRQLRRYHSLGVSGIVRKGHLAEVCEAVETCANQLLTKSYAH